jgi:hypothetical protein
MVQNKKKSFVISSEGKSGGKKSPIFLRLHESPEGIVSTLMSPESHIHDCVTSKENHEYEAFFNATQKGEGLLDH